MTYMVLLGIGEYNNVDYTNKASLPILPGDHYIQLALERRRRVSRTEWHTDILIMSGVANKQHLMAIFLLQHYLPVAAVGFERRKDVCFSELIYAFVHSRNWVRLLHRHRI